MALPQMDKRPRVGPRCSCGIDVHAHVVPMSFPQYLKGAPPKGWPSMEPAHACHRHVMVDGRVYRTVSHQCWDVPKRISDMAEMGLSLQAISPMPELFSYWMDLAPACDLLHFINDQMAEMVVQSNGHLTALGAVPLQDVEKAIAELHRLKGELGFAGVEIGSNVNGRPIGAPEFDPFFAAAEELDMAVFVHAVRPAGMDRLMGPAPLQQVLGYPTDVGLAAASIITTNLLLRRPRLRIAFSHGGGTLASLLPRLEEGYRVFKPLAESIQESPSLQARKFYYDALVYDAPTLRHLIDRFGDTQIMLGTDYPFNFHDRIPVARVEEALTEGSSLDALLSKNASRFLNLPEIKS